MKACVVLIVFFIGSCIKAFAIDAAVSHTLFYLPGASNNEWKAYTEIIWEINPKKLTWAGKDGIYTAKIKTHIACSQNGKIINEDDYILETKPVKNNAEVLAQHIMEMHKFLLPSGKVNIAIRLIDVADSSNRFNYVDSIIIPENHSEVFYSNLQFLDTSFTSTQASVFRKNNKQQIPLSSAFYDESRNRLHFYGELYGTQNLSAEHFPLKQRVYISKHKEDVPYPNLIIEDTIIKQNIVPVSGSLNISKLVSGNYYLNIEVFDVLNHNLHSSSILFQRYNNHPPQADSAELAKTDSILINKPVSVLDLDKTFLSKYTNKQILAILRMLLPISDERNAQIIATFLKQPDEMYTRYYVYNFFSNLNPKDPAKAWKEFSEKIKEINSLFGSGSNVGYQTDRGVIYLKYGKPSDRFVVANESGSYPYEVWQYNSIKLANKQFTNALFLFYKPGDGMSEMKLLHSNVPTEVNNRYWRNYLYINGNSAGNSSSQAESYIGNK
jgi:GWxTD domain-containing protein